MNANELADKLEGGGFALITPEEEALRNKCVRFAADMEMMIADGSECTFTRGWDAVFVDCDNVNASGSDIYSAARKAVEQLEEKR